jgi:hypothetical protein
MYYKKIYSSVNINTSKHQDEISIGINCNNNKSSVYYQMTFKDNKYYLNSKREDYDEMPYFIIE